MITVVGTGTGAPLPQDVAAGAALVVGGRRHLDAVRLPAGAERVVLGPLAPALDTVAGYVEKELPVLVLASGDPGFFGIVRVLAERFGAERLSVRPGVSSVATAFARLGLPWDDAVVVSAHGRALRTAVHVCRARPKVAVLTGPGAGPAELGAALAGRDRVLVVASALGDPVRERVERVTPAEAAARDWGTAVSVVLCLATRRGPDAAGAPSVPDEPPVPPVPHVPDVPSVPDASLVPRVPGALAGAAPGPSRWALEESEFAHRDSMITKFEVRALALARLGPRLGDLVWDVGAGSGSVAVECARLGAAVVAVEKSADGVARIRENARAHGVEVDVVHGTAPDALDGLAQDPDAVFIGGGGRELPAVIRACAPRARRAVVVAMAALDRVPAAREALTGAGLRCDGVLLQSSRLAPLPGEVTRLAATNPVFLLWGVRSPVSNRGVDQ
ncbi:precorrin-6y C5,15-methyltransferase (decarboxylating) subunit CbiE [Streptomyces sp. NEAU-sy36]|uniref:precorrin-6y C5,15-methyltransferase (decarboxylating) subunit CbiE n=1 Tax=unclassified Streptomyces TaxID=2593676 RepID=UPI0015D5780F|nr:MULTISPECIES: precorrin-6y C5,15-methyltransferase (decarboxylating) subunit CbiE [unclassified Streptomyces]QLJ01078.1 precorrin-6y C5,15-methyltransferase (decarboxylating) subunit CbiE [Streptomyces sp. NEAU-sy36]